MKCQMNGQWCELEWGRGRGRECLQQKGSRVNALRNSSNKRGNMYHTIDLICNCVCCTFYVGGLWKGEVGRGGGEG